MLPSTDEKQQGPVHLVEDDDALREAMVRGFRLQGIPAVGYATGEAFLAQWQPGMRGVVTLDIDLSPRGGMNGDKVFDRLMALRSHLPVVFLTGPYGHHVRMCADLVRRREYVDYFGKNEPHEHVEARIQQFLRDEPPLYEKAVKERWLLQQLAVEMTHGERVALEGPLNGLNGRDWAEELGAGIRTLEIQRGAGLGRITRLEAISGDKITVLAMMVAPLMERMGATGDKEGRGRLIQLAAIELGHRLRLLDEPQQVALQTALQGRPASPTAHEQVDGALRLMSIEDIAQLRNLLKTGGQEMLGYMLPALPDPRHRWVRHWLLWVAPRPGVTGWEQLPELPDA